MPDEIPITVKIAERPYRLMASMGEEETIRKAVKLIEAQISHYAGAFRHSDKQDLLAMVALHFTTTAINARNESLFISDGLMPALNEIEKTLTETLKD